jgi:4-amino-4-deoxy-L-arabinose transferase-like glycosyltransferase
VAVFALAALALTGFDGLYGQDSFAYFHYATGPLRESLLHLQPPPPFFWPPGYPLLVALLSAMVGVVPLTGQLVSIAGGAAVPGFTVLLAREMGRPDRTTGMNLPWRSVPLIAGLVVAATGQLLQSSIVVMSDTLGLAAATAGAWAIARYRRTGEARWLAISAGAFAWAIDTRWIYGLVALPFAGWALALLARRPRRTALRHAAAAGAVAAVILGPTLVAAIAGLIAGGNAPFAGDLQVYSWSPLNALRHVFTTGDGQLIYSLPNGLYYAVAPGSWWYFGPLLAALIVAGLWAVLRRRVAPGAGLLVAWAGAVYLFHAGAPWQNPRFALAYLPPLAILAAVGFSQLRASGGRSIRRAASVWLISGLALAAVGSAVLTDRFIERKQNDVATVRWAERLAPPHAQLLTFGLTATFQHYGQVPTVDLSEISPVKLARVLSDGRPTLVLLDVAGVERQWRGRPPWENYRSLRDGPGLHRLAVRDVYTLFSVPESPP